MPKHISILYSILLKVYVKYDRNRYDKMSHLAYSILFAYIYIMVKELFEVESHLTPSVFVSPVDGKHYIVPMWKEVPVGTTLDQIVHIKLFAKKEQWEIVAQIKAKRGSTMYDISRLENRVKCSCSKGKGCAHIKDYFDSMGIKIVTK